MDWLKYLESAEPARALLVGACGIILWLVKDRTRMQAALDVANQDRLNIRDLRTADLERTTKEFTAQAVAMVEVVREFNAKWRR